MNIKLYDGRFLGDNQPAYIIAEVGINHNGSFDLALEMIDVAAKTGVDAVKFQKRSIYEMYTKSFLDQPYNKNYSFGRTYGEHKLFLEFSDDQFYELKKRAHSYNLDFIVSGFDKSAFDFINYKLDVQIHKIASPFINHYPLLRHVAGYGKPVILSTGMHSYDEIKNAVNYIRQFNPDIILLQATTLYPCPDELVNLRTLEAFRNDLNILVGYSSHDKGVILPAASVALGACVIEKHFTLDRTMIGPDHAASVEPRGMEMIVKYAHIIEKGLGDGRKLLNKEEEDQRIKYGVSIVTKRTLKKGDRITINDITVKCPGGGVSPIKYEDIIGKLILNDIEEDEIIYPKDIEI